jgi:hypothetical protein
VLGAIPSLDLGVSHGGHDVDPGHIHQDVQPAQPLRDSLHRGIDRALRGDIALREHSHAALTVDSRSHCLARLHISIDDANLASLRGEEQCCGAADPVASARDLRSYTELVRVRPGQSLRGGTAAGLTSADLPAKRLRPSTAATGGAESWSERLRRRRAPLLPPPLLLVAIVAISHGGPPDDAHGRRGG